MYLVTVKPLYVRAFYVMIIAQLLISLSDHNSYLHMPLSRAVTTGRSTGGMQRKLQEYRQLRLLLSASLLNSIPQSQWTVRRRFARCRRKLHRMWRFVR